MVFVLAGCAVQTAETIWVRPGTLAFEAEQATVACTQRARVQFPEDRAIETTPSAVIGVGVGNRRHHHDRRSGGVFGAVGVDIFEVDRNEPRRDAAFAACLGRQGYAPVTLPSCRPGEAMPLESQPFDTRGLCVANGRLAATR